MSFHFRIRDFFYPLSIARCYKSFRRNPWLPGEQLRAFQLRRLRDLLDRAQREVPYYRRLFRSLPFQPACLEDPAQLTRLPLLTREMLRSHYFELQAQGGARHRPQSFRTSGSSDRPVQFLLDRHIRTVEFVYHWRHWSWFGYRLGDCFAQIRGHPGLDGAEAPLVHWQPALRRLLINPFRISPLTAPAIARAFRKYHPRFLKSSASLLYCLALSLEEAGITDLRLEAIFSGNETLQPAQRQKIQQVFQAPVADSYGHMESTVKISECPRGSLHVDSDYGLLELADLRPASEGGSLLADIIGTSFYNRSMPLIRYQVGDTVEVDPQQPPCPCGRTFPVVRRVLGRSTEVIVTPDGRYIWHLCLLHLFVRGLECYQVIQEEPRRLRILVTPSSSRTPESLEGDLKAVVRRFVGGGMRIQVEFCSHQQLERSPSGKLLPVISRLSPPLAGNPPRW